MELTLYNSYTRKKELFTPINDKRVTIYACGPTVYGPGHIGNGRSAIVFDTLTRLLRYKYEKVIYARNITDVDDKIITASKDEGISVSEITDKYTKQYHKDFEQLNVLPPDIEPFATDHINEMISFINELISNKNAYISDSNVLFDVSSFHEYGSLSGRKVEDMIPGSRIQVASYKKGSSDFILWKPSKENEIGWESPWGRGRPGWHLECSTMIKKHLGETIDIHGGGEDLTFPHHENELAQSKCCNKKNLSNFWVHNGLLRVNNNKMSKSMKNFVLMKDLLKDYDGEIIRLAMLGSHYRQPLIWSDDLISQSKKTINNLYNSIKDLDSNIDINNCKPDDKVLEALHDDLNTPKALAEIFSISKNISKSKNKDDLVRSLVGSANLIGLLKHKSIDKMPKQKITKEIKSLIKQREIARQNKDYKESDKLREILLGLGVEINDT
ncbi:MAG: cysteine--tRNA ligase [Candidatus Dadabacteria bacterium]|nr:MAG: cysteine--tRNA ligase [Candidatus Dadabacteria bacterium]